MRSVASVFTQVNYSGFRAALALHQVGKISSGGYETVIYDQDDLPLAISHAASIDERGRCHPTSYYVRSDAMAFTQPDQHAA